MRKKVHSRKAPVVPLEKGGSLCAFLFAAVLCGWLCVLPCFASYANVQKNLTNDCASGPACAKAYGVNPTANHLLVVWVRNGNGTSTTSQSVADTIGNSWTALTSVDQTTNLRLQGFFAVNSTTAADTVTVSVAPNASLRIAIYEYSGNATSGVLDVQSTGSGASGTSLASGSITPNQANSLVMAAGAVSGTETCTAGTNFTMEDQVPAAPNTKLCVEDWIQTTATATTGPMTISASDTWGAGVVAFKPASGAAPAGTNKRQKYEQMDPQRRM